MKLPKILQKNLLFLAMGAFVFTALIMFRLAQPEKKYPVEVEAKKEIVKIIPLLTNGSNYPIISAQSVYAIDVESGEVLYEKDPDKQSLPASTAKIITALVALDYFPVDMVVSVRNLSVVGQKMGLVKEEQITIENLLYGLLVYSANDAAEVLAQNFPGGRDLFISTMNLKAKQLGLENTHFVHPAGLDGVGQYTTAKDLVVASQSVMNDDYLANIVGTKEKTVFSVDGKIVHKLTNINKLIGKVDGVLGVKTGWTEDARENLVTYVERDERKVYMALLGSQDRFGETEEIIEWIYDSYSWVEVVVSEP